MQCYPEYLLTVMESKSLEFKDAIPYETLQNKAIKKYPKR